MQRSFLPRRLSYSEQSEIRTVANDGLLGFKQPLVILGDAGMGKTRLMNWLGEQPGFRFVTARRLLNDSDARSLLGHDTGLVIDALDEVAAQAEGDAVDHVLRKVSSLGQPRFIVSCRAADWRSATGKVAIGELYDEPPLELYLDPLDSDQAREFLAANARIGAQRSSRIVEGLVQRGFGNWLGNPQTLLMLEPLLEESEPPETTAMLFEQYVERVWNEHNERKAQSALNTSSRDEVLDALGAGFAALILTGKTGLYRGAAANAGQSEIPIAELKAIPHGDAIERFASSRLVKSEGDCLTYQHRRIGEYLGARWLVRHANSPSRRRRLLTMFRSTSGLVPAYLRGLHAWLAWHDEELAQEVVDADPMGVIEYGDADGLSARQGRRLLNSLQALVERNPLFRGWGELRARGLIQASTADEVRKIILDRDRPFSLRLTLVEQLDSVEAVEAFRAELVQILNDERFEIGIRRRAGDLLSDHDPHVEWSSQLEALRERSTSDSIRLAAELITRVGLDKFPDQLIIEIVAADAGLTLCPVPRETNADRAGQFYVLESTLRDDRLEHFLDLLSAFVRPLIATDPGIEFNEFVDFAYELILRRLNGEPVEPRKLWSWVEPYEDHHGFRRETRDRISTWLREHDDVRRGIQAYVLLEREGQKTVWERAWRMIDAIPGLAPTHADAIILLSRLDAADKGDVRWRDLVQMVPHDGEVGADVREAARPFALGDHDSTEWLASLAARAKPEWQVRQEKRALREADERQKRWAEHRKSFGEARNKLRAGDAKALVSPAQAYLGLFSDVEAENGPASRISVWLGEELLADVLAGFRSFLLEDPSKPTAEDIAKSYVHDRHWHAAYIIIAALAEHAKTDPTFESVPKDRLIAGGLELEHQRFRDIDHESLAKSVQTALRNNPRDYERYLRLLVEPGLAARRTHVSGLYSAMRDPPDPDFANTLARDWIVRFPRLAAEPEEELIDRLIRAGDVEFLSAVAARRKRNKLDERRRRNWQAVRLLTNFDEEQNRQHGVGARDPDFLWVLRARFGGGRHRGSAAPLPLPLAAWIVSEFRKSFPSTYHPVGSSTGDTNAWDAADYLRHLINLIGEDVSDDGIELLNRLLEVSDGYSEHLRVVAAEQAAKRADQDHSTPSIAEIAAIVNGGPPRSPSDLQTVVVEELDRIQALVRSDDVDSWTGFYANASALQPNHEEECSNYLINLLRQNGYGLRFDPEPHLAADRQGDIGCSFEGLWIPIEAKGQWHPKLWVAADEQLHGQQASDHRAAGRGIYVVYWFGSRGKPLTRAPAAFQNPASPEELERRLAEHSSAARSGRVVIKVLDVAR